VGLCTGFALLRSLQMEYVPRDASASERERVRVRTVLSGAVSAGQRTFPVLPATLRFVPDDRLAAPARAIVDTAALHGN
jgi:hypothetical protein